MDSMTRVAARTPATLEMLLGSRSSDSGVAELAGVAVVWMAGCTVMLRKASVNGALFAWQGKPGSWWSLALRYPVLVLLHSLAIDLSGYLRERVAMKWRRNMTRKLHRLYFQKHNFYRLQAEAREHVISDADVRICRDVHDMAYATSEVAVAGIEAMVKTIVFAGVSVLQRHWLWGLFPSLFFLVVVKFVLGVQPTQGSNVQTSLHHFETRLRQHLSRLQTRCRSILMLQGEAFELDLLQKCLRDMSGMAKKMYDVMFPLEMAEWMCLHSTQAATMLELVAFVSAAGFGMRYAHDGSFEQHSDAIGRHLRNVQNFFSACSGWNAFLGSRTLLMSSTAATNRVKQLYTRLERYDQPQIKAKPKRRSTSKDVTPEIFVDKGEMLSFQSVTIQSPSKQALLRDLSFSVSPGSPLLICGHVQAGKSAIARCLFALPGWPVTGGPVARPGGFSRSAEGIPYPEDVLYMPERPILGMASLSDEITFPRPLPSGLPVCEQQKWLAYVGLDHLVSNADLLGLSLQEQQALGFARLLFHRPRFAILDECTSAMPQLLERRFLRLARELGVCCVTIVRRPTQSLKDEHTQMLVVHGAHGEDTRGWRLFELPAAKREATMKPRVRSSTEAFQRLDAYLEVTADWHEEELAETAELAEPAEVAEPVDHPATSSRSSPQLSPCRGRVSGSISACETVTKRWRSRASRLWATLQLGLLTSGRRRTILQKVGLMLLLLHTRTKLYWRFCRALSGGIRALLMKDVGCLVRELCFGSLSVMAGGFADQLLRYQMNLTTVELWTGAITHLQRKLLRELTLMRVSEEVAEPFQRLAEVRNVFEGLGAAGCDSLPSLAQLVFVAPLLVRRLGAWSLALPLHLLLLRWLAGLLEAGQCRAAEREARFQAQHSRLRENSETLALSCRGIAERQILENEFEVLAQEGLELPLADLLKRVVFTSMADFRQAPSCLVRLLSLLFVSATLSNAGTLAGHASMDVLCSTFLFDRMLQAAFIAIQQLAKCWERAGQLDAQCSRCLELVVAVEAASKRLPPPSADVTEEVMPMNKSDALRLAEDELVTEDGMLLARRLQFEVAPADPMVIGGPRGFSQPLLSKLLLGGWNRSCWQPRLLAQLIYPLILRLPSHAPFTVHLPQLPEAVSESVLSSHFAALGAASCQVVNHSGVRKGLVLFSTFEELVKAVARPQDRVIANVELHCEIGDSSETASVDSAGPPQLGEALPRLVRMRECLRAVGLDYLLTREPDGWFARRPWADVLTLEEQQRLCIARLLYHQPAFCILEDATSALSPTSESHLHELLREWGMTPLALSSAAFLTSLYRTHLQVGLGLEADSSGWNVDAPQC